MNEPIPAYPRLRWALVGAVVSLALVAITWFVARSIQSPQDVLAAAQPPAPSVITVPVERRVLNAPFEASAQVTERHRAVGYLDSAQREIADHAEHVSARVAQRWVPAALTRVEPDGRFVVLISRTTRVKNGEPVAVRFETNQDSPSLVVPISALFTAGSGETAVIVVRSNSQKEVTVSMGRVVGGFVDVVPADKGALTEGDQVLVSEPARRE